MGSISSSIPKSRLQPHARNRDANAGVRCVKTSEAERKRGSEEKFQEGVSSRGRRTQLKVDALNAAPGILSAALCGPLGLCG